MSNGKASEAQVKVVASGSAELGKYGGPDASIEDRIRAVLSDERIVIFGKTYCPFCLSAKKLFDDLGVPYVNFNVDATANGGEVHAVLKKEYTQTTVPYVFVNKEFLGGCDDTKKLAATGALDTKLARAGFSIKPTIMKALAQCAVAEGKPRVQGALLNFPDVVDDRVVRLIAFQIFVLSVLVAIYYPNRGAHWVMCGMLVDFVIRFVGGGNASPIGSAGALITSIFDSWFGFKPKWVNGAPKQFAVMCGIMFTGLAFFFFVTSTHERDLNIVGLSFTCALAVAAGLEAFLGFCLGCWMFGLMIRIGIMPETVHNIATSIKHETEYTYNEMNIKRLNEGVPPAGIKHFDDVQPVQIDFKYKCKTDDMTKEDFHLIKHVKMTHFIMHMGTIGLACVWRGADRSGFGVNAPKGVWYALAIASGSLYSVWFVLYLLKIFMYPRKVHKEWMCNRQGNTFVAPFICMVLFSYLVLDPATDFSDKYRVHYRRFAQALFWTGAPTSLFVSMIRVGNWIYDKKEMEHINAGWMIMPVGNFVAAMIGPLLQPNFRDAMQLWYAFAFAMWAVLFVITFYKAIIVADYDDRLRPFLAIWVAAPAVGATAYVSCFYPDMRWFESGNDFIFLNLWWLSVVLTFIFAWGFIKPYFGRTRFEMVNWAACFPADALALCSFYYKQHKAGPFSEAICFTCIAVACYFTSTCMLQTLIGLVRRQIFVPEYKWGPLSFMRITHEAIRGAVPRLLDACKACKEGDLHITGPALKEHWRLMDLAHDEHSKHEDQVIFARYETYFPGVSARNTHEHEQHHELMHTITDKINAAVETKSADLINQVSELLERYAAEVEQHLRGEEDHLQGMPRKYMNLAITKEIVRECWKLTPAAKWFEYIPWVVNNLPMLPQRVRFLKALLWAMPERAEQIGIMLALGVDDVQWKRITDELPELIPRGAPGWERYF